MFALLLFAACRTAPSLPDEGALPAFSFTDQTNRTVTLETLAGKVWVADFFFTSCPSVCPILTAHMAEVQAHYKDQPDVRFVSFSVDPATDQPPVLAAYGKKHGVDDARWHLLTGPVDEMKKVVVDSFKQVLERQPAADGKPADILHGTRFVIVDRKGHIRAFVHADEPGKTTLYASVDALLAER